jgi:uncharacterized protein
MPRRADPNRAISNTCARYSRDRSFIGGRLLGLVPPAVLLPLLAVIFVLSAIKVWLHK